MRFAVATARFVARLARAGSDVGQRGGDLREHLRLCPCLADPLRGGECLWVSVNYCCSYGGERLRLVPRSDDAANDSYGLLSQPTSADAVDAGQPGDDIGQRLGLRRGIADQLRCSYGLDRPTD